MKTILPKRSHEVQDKLDYIVQQILTVAKDKIAMIIFYGSYARGDWVKDMYTEDYITYSDISDFGFLVVLKKVNLRSMLL
ncbi:MAG: nucleotidyltransferase domain-containing protein [Rickettsia endosymbiont of Ixodes persulcatus]|nr:nucleotidyltransferase domain-containing protein [Rickettsia endosymbiont of Ixodes persulcatus]MCZ6901902.1 nucleotidyltransferase domain-containing protein [Rickettsia endosymbiont of Ixodes persulcatus]MCZ6903868.1 nucleotidyltransferase domain-containing protein [Rickettsia endosymbiont of Ixodes persulcatus]MCZ6909332.1 nucleotidyltransferase domain-containing protein [Rickettsia endosymbiont of Ixodes persulcatus]MCZ6910290.1 nucleotidyltransferase domain-containing protein [Rickettsia